MRRLFRRLLPPVLALTAALTTHELLPRWSPQGAPLRSETTPPFEPPDDPSSIYLNNMHNELSQPLLYHGIGPSIERAKAAEILIFGNSRAQLGLREEFILPRAKEIGVGVFSIACGNAEGGGFLLELMREHDLRPKVLVVSGGPFLFHTGMSPRAAKAMQLTRWQARQEIFEGRAAWEIRHRLHRRLPKLDPWHPPTFDTFVVVYRSQETGWWQPVWERGSRFPIRLPSEVEGARLDRTHEFMEELQAEAERRGSLLVLTAVPWGRSELSHLPYLGSRYDVPVVPPLVADGLATLDGSHLDRDSARRVSEAFWQRFTRLPRVRDRLDLPHVREQPEPASG